MIEILVSTNADWVIATVRIVLGLVFFAHGAQMLLGWYGGQGFSSSMQSLTEQLHLPATVALLVISGEFFGGIGLVVGLFSRRAAFVSRSRWSVRLRLFTSGMAYF